MRIVVRGTLKIAANAVIFAIVFNGCAPRLTVIPERDQDAEQVARDQRACEEGTAGRYTMMTGKALGLGAAGAAVGAVSGAVLGLGVGLYLEALGGGSTSFHPWTEVIGVAAIGAAIGALIGAFAGPRKAVQEEQEAVAREFARCMQERGYTVGRAGLLWLPLNPVALEDERVADEAQLGGEQICGTTVRVTRPVKSCLRMQCPRVDLDTMENSGTDVGGQLAPPRLIHRHPGSAPKMEEILSAAARSIHTFLDP